MYICNIYIWVYSYAIRFWFWREYIYSLSNYLLISYLQIFIVLNTGRYIAKWFPYLRKAWCDWETQHILVSSCLMLYVLQIAFIYVVSLGSTAFGKFPAERDPRWPPPPRVQVSQRDAQKHCDLLRQLTSEPKSSNSRAAHRPCEVLLCKQTHQCTFVFVICI